MAKNLTEDDIETGLVSLPVGTWNYRHLCACPGGDILGCKVRLDNGSDRDNRKQVIHAA